MHFHCADVEAALSRDSETCRTGIEASLTALGVGAGWPIALVLTLVECAAIVALYRVVLGWQGQMLEWRELKILETVTAKVE